MAGRLNTLLGSAGAAIIAAAVLAAPADAINTYYATPVP